MLSYLNCCWANLIVRELLLSIAIEDHNFHKCHKFNSWLEGWYEWYDLELLVVGNLNAQSNHGNDKPDQGANKHLVIKW